MCVFLFLRSGFQGENTGKSEKKKTRGQKIRSSTPIFTHTHTQRDRHTRHVFLVCGLLGVGKKQASSPCCCCVGTWFLFARNHFNYSTRSTHTKYIFIQSGISGSIRKWHTTNYVEQAKKEGGADPCMHLNASPLILWKRKNVLLS